jgi:acyl-CoA reductase-like NAD-dependent aldehyde dehydrogenase
MGKVVSVNPTTGEIFGVLEDSSNLILSEKIIKARNNLSWSKRSIVERVVIIEKFASLLGEYKEELARTMAMEMGKPLSLGRHEVEIAIKRVKEFCKMIPSFIEDEIIFEDEKEKNIVIYEPLGVVAVISPWNAPVFVSLAGIVPPFLCGNNIIWKPSEYTSFTGLVLKKIFMDLENDGLSDGVFQCVIGGRSVGKKLVESEVDMVSLTGSVRAGKIVGGYCGGKLRPFVLELGGKDSAIVLEDADLDLAAREIVKNSNMNSGQVCFAVERVYCQERVYSDFLDKCVDETKKLKVGDPMDEDVDIGPFAVKFQMDHVLGQINDALENGARLLCGGKWIARKGYFLTPGVMIDVNHSMRIMREETFGPITCIMKYKDIDEGIRLVNDSNFGLTASIWTSNLKKGEEIARRIEAGTVEINRAGMSKAGCPWGGYKNSGFGRIYSKEGIRNFCNVKHIWVMKD